jgi:hypothetical protein
LLPLHIAGGWIPVWKDVCHSQSGAECWKKPKPAIPSCYSLPQTVLVKGKGVIENEGKQGSGHL